MDNMEKQIEQLRVEMNELRGRVAILENTRQPTYAQGRPLHDFTVGEFTEHKVKEYNKTFDLQEYLDFCRSEQSKESLPIKLEGF